MPSWNASFLWIIFFALFLMNCPLLSTKLGPLLARPHLCGVGAEEFGNNSYGWSICHGVVLVTEMMKPYKSPFVVMVTFFFFFLMVSQILYWQNFACQLAKMCELLNLIVTYMTCTSCIDSNECFMLQSWTFHFFFFFLEIQSFYHLSDDMMLQWKPQVRSYTSFISPNYLMPHFLSIVQGIWAWMISMSDGLLHFYFGWLSAI